MEKICYNTFEGCSKVSLACVGDSLIYRIYAKEKWYHKLFISEVIVSKFINLFCDPLWKDGVSRIEWVINWHWIIPSCPLTHPHDLDFLVSYFIVYLINFTQSNDSSLFIYSMKEYAIIWINV